MNLLHVKYAVVIAEQGSVNKASEKLYVSQPNLSRAIKELEANLGITIFERSAKGMHPTPDGEVFIRYAKSVLRQVDAIEELFSSKDSEKKRFSVSVPRASYFCKAFTDFSLTVDKSTDIELFYKETNALRAIKNILSEDYGLGVIRYANNYKGYYEASIEEKGLKSELITEFSYVLLMNKDSKLASLETVTYEDLKGYTEIAHGDPYVPSLSLSEVRKTELPETGGRRILVFERSSQFELLSKDTQAFMWVSPVPKEQLERYGLVQKTCPENRRIYRDVLIYRKNYKLTELDKRFVDCLLKACKEN